MGKLSRQMEASRTKTPIILLKKTTNSIADPFMIRLCPNRYGWDNRMPGGRMVILKKDVEYTLEPENLFNTSAKGDSINVVIHVYDTDASKNDVVTVVEDYVKLSPLPVLEHEGL